MDDSILLLLMSTLVLVQDIQEGHVVVTQSAPPSRKPRKKHR